MQRILILGGTSWLGSKIARPYVDVGNFVTVLARGRSGMPPSGVRFIRTDFSWPHTYDQVNGEFDEVVELVYLPNLVKSALDALAHGAKHRILISRVFVCTPPWATGGATSYPLVDPSNFDEYPDRKPTLNSAAASPLEHGCRSPGLG